MNPTTKTVILMSVLLFAATTANAGGRCFHAEIPQTMVLPDGSVHDPGILRLCLEQKISPVSTLHRGDVEGRPVGMLSSAPRPIELAVEEGQAQFVFTPNDEDKLALMGYAVRVGRETTFFDMSRFGATRTTTLFLIPNSSDHEVAVVLVAGR